jgi:hypothetical protein
MAKKTVKQVKDRQGYTNVNPVCSNCVKFSMETERIEGAYGAYAKEKNLRCTLGGFACKKSNWCPSHVFVKAESF